MHAAEGLPWVHEAEGLLGCMQQRVSPGYMKQRVPPGCMKLRVPPGCMKLRASSVFRPSRGPREMQALTIRGCQLPRLSTVSASLRSAVPPCMPCAFGGKRRGPRRPEAGTWERAYWHVEGLLTGTWGSLGYMKLRVSLGCMELRASPGCMKQRVSLGCMQLRVSLGCMKLRVSPGCMKQRVSLGACS